MRETTSWARYIKVKVEHYLLFMFSPPKISWLVSGIKYICLHLLPVFYLIQPSSKQFICFDFQKEKSVLPIWCSMYLDIEIDNKLGRICPNLAILSSLIIFDIFFRVFARTTKMMLRTVLVMTVVKSNNNFQISILL